MMAAYWARLVCLCFAAFFLLHLVLGVAAAAVAPALLRRAGRMSARSATGYLLALRLAPAAVALSVVLGLCLPSYLMFEPGVAGERMNLLCAGSACLGLLVWLLSAVRSVRALTRSIRYARKWRRAGLETCIYGRTHGVIVERSSALLALCGIVSPRVLISSGVLRALSSDELEVAVDHERAHGDSRDNLKRLLWILAPDVVPFRRAFSALETAWTSFSEWAADDEAAQGNPARAVSLASALIRLARMEAAPGSPLIASLTAGGRNLEARVERLLRVAPQGSSRASGPMQAWTVTGLAAAVSGSLAAGAFFLPAVLASLYRFLEALIH